MDDGTCAYTKIGEHAVALRDGGWPELGVRASWLSAARAEYIGVYAGRDASYIIPRAALMRGRRVRTGNGAYIVRHICEWEAQGRLYDIVASLHRLGVSIQALPADCAQTDNSHRTLEEN